MGSTSLLVNSFLVAAALKVLLFPAYHSTDFEVHRNWLALTSSLPVSRWYYEATSEWTLDYPPFFAYFEWCLAQVARRVDPAMLEVSNLGYASWATVAFQRGSVMATETVLLLSLIAFVRTAPLGQRSAAQAAALSILLSPGLLLIDHVHFQYNGMMYGLLIFSLVLARRGTSSSPVAAVAAASSSSSSSSSMSSSSSSQSGLLWSGVVFAVLLCFKHIYAYVAPAYAAFLFGAYCQGRSWYSVRWANGVRLGVGLAAVLAAAFGPFAYLGQMPQLLARLFPFQRGLTHAYWAPNAWALYSFADRVMIAVAPYAGFKVDAQAASSLTRGLVGDVQFAVLPDVGSRASGLITIASMLPALLKVWLHPTWRNFVSTVTLCGYSSFLFGYHVHEKAILLVIIPFSLVALTDRRHLSAFRPLANAGYVSLLPLLFDRETTPIKIVYTLTWLVAFNVAFERLAPPPIRGSSRIFLLDRLSLLWDVVALPLVAYSQMGVHELIWGDRYQFLPLMFMSTYCALGVVGSWLGFMVVFFTAPAEKAR